MESYSSGSTSVIDVYMKACKTNGIAQLLQLLADPELRFLLNVRDPDLARTGLHYAAASGCDEAVAYLLQFSELSINMVDGEGHTALQLACLHSRLNIAKDLIAGGATTDSLTFDGVPNTTVAWMVQQGVQAPLTRVLDMSSCRLEWLPDGRAYWSSFVCLETIDISANNLDWIPCAVAMLSSQIEVLVDGNPLKGFPPAVLQSASGGSVWSVLQKHLRHLKSAADGFQYGRVAILGPSGAGKTSLFQCLTGHQKSNFSKVLASVVSDSGSDDVRSQVELASNINVAFDIVPGATIRKLLNMSTANRPRYTFVDVSGKDEVLPVHSFFIPPGSVYLIVFDLTKADEQIPMLEYWLTILSNTGSKKQLTAPIIVVGTHADDPLCSESYIEEKLNLVMQHYPPNRFSQISKTMVAVSSTTRMGLSDVQQEIEVLAEILRTKIDPPWLNVMQYIRSIHQATPFISRRQFIRICYRNGVIYDKLRPLVQFLKDIGLIVHRDDGKRRKLKNIVVLDVKWMADLMLRWLGTDDEGLDVLHKFLATGHSESGAIGVSKSASANAILSLSPPRSPMLEQASKTKAFGVDIPSSRAKSFVDLAPSTLFGGSLPTEQRAELRGPASPSSSRLTLSPHGTPTRLIVRHTGVSSPSKKSPVTFSVQEEMKAKRPPNSVSDSRIAPPGLLRPDSIADLLFDVPKKHYSNVLRLLHLMRFICFSSLHEPISVPLLLPLEPDEESLQEHWPVEAPTDGPYPVIETKDVIEFESIPIEFFGRLLARLVELPDTECKLMWRDGAIIHRSVRTSRRMVRNSTLLLNFVYWRRDFTVNRIVIRARAATVPRRKATPNRDEDVTLDGDNEIDVEPLRDIVLRELRQFVDCFYTHLLPSLVHYAPALKSDDRLPAMQPYRSVRSRSYSYSAHIHLSNRKRAAKKVQHIQPEKVLDPSPDRREYRGPLLEYMGRTRHPSGEVHCMSFIDTRNVWVAADDGFIEVYQLQEDPQGGEGQLVSTGVRWNAHASRITSMVTVRQHFLRGCYAVKSASSKGRGETSNEGEDVVGTVWTGAKDGTLRVWDVNTTQLLFSTANESEIASILVVQFQDQNAEVWSVSPSDSAIRIWNVSDFSMRRLELDLIDETGSMPYISCMTQQRSWVLVGAERWICIIDVYSKEMKGFWKVNHDAIRNLHAVVGTNFVWSYSLYSPIITVWQIIDLESIEEVKHLEVHKAKLTTIHSMMTCTGQSIVVTGSYDHQVVIWDAVTLRALGSADCSAIVPKNASPQASPPPSEIPMTIRNSEEGILIATGFKNAKGLQSNLTWFQSSQHLDTHKPINLKQLLSVTESHERTLITDLVAPGDRPLAEIESNQAYPKMEEALSKKLIRIAEVAETGTLDSLLDIAGQAGDIVQEMGALRDNSIMAADLVLPLYICAVAKAMAASAHANLDVYHAIVNLQYSFVDFGNNNAACQLSHVIVAAQVVPQLLQLHY